MNKARIQIDQVLKKPDFILIENMNVLFVCTGNIFRSMSAEFLMKKYLTDQGITTISVSSAGTTARLQSGFDETFSRLDMYGCDASQHEQTKLTEEILAHQDVVICMAEHHRTTVRELGYDAVLFNEIAYGKTEDLMDDTEYGEKFGSDYDLGAYVNSIVDYIHDGIPFVVNNILLFK